MFLLTFGRELQILRSITVSSEITILHSHVYSVSGMNALKKIEWIAGYEQKALVLCK